VMCHKVNCSCSTFYRQGFQGSDGRRHRSPRIPRRVKRPPAAGRSCAPQMSRSVRSGARFATMSQSRWLPFRSAVCGRTNTEHGEHNLDLRFTRRPTNPHTMLNLGCFMSARPSPASPPLRKRNTSK
jgi:hypothetical protein